MTVTVLPADRNQFIINVGDDLPDPRYDDSPDAEHNDGKPQPMTWARARRRESPASDAASLRMAGNRQHGALRNSISPALAIQAGAGHKAAQPCDLERVLWGA